jgi:hypothetical protein
MYVSLHVIGRNPINPQTKSKTIFLHTIPKLASFYHLMLSQTAYFDQQMWWYSQHPDGGHIPEQSRQIGRPTVKDKNYVINLSKVKDWLQVSESKV